MTRRLSENARRHVGETLTIRWGTSRGRDSYGYTTCTLRNQRGERVAACNGGGYDMKGTVIGDWVAKTFRKELLALKESSFPRASHWEPNPQARRYCLECHLQSVVDDADPDWLAHDAETCPKCGGATRADRKDGKRVDGGPRFYGLTYHDPNYDPGTAIVSEDCLDRTLTGATGKTVDQAEKDGDSFGLERYQAFYQASSPVPTKRHTAPRIDGACGLSSVLDILRAIGLDLRFVTETGKVTVYEIVRA